MSHPLDVKHPLKRASSLDVLLAGTHLFPGCSFWVHLAAIWKVYSFSIPFIPFIPKNPLHIRVVWCSFQIGKRFVLSLLLCCRVGFNGLSSALKILKALGAAGGTMAPVPLRPGEARWTAGCPLRIEHFVLVKSNLYKLIFPVDLLIDLEFCRHWSMMLLGSQKHTWIRIILKSGCLPFILRLAWCIAAWPIIHTTDVV